MTISILTAGTRGDIQPYIALGIALKKAGYSVRVATFENYGTFIKSFGLEFYPIQGDVSKITASDSVSGARTADNPLKIALSFQKLKSYVFDLQKDFFNACTDSEAIVYHPGVPIGYFTAQYLRIPSILATPFPMTPTGDYPALIFYNLPRFGRAFNRISHKLFEQVIWFASGAAVKKFWQKEFGRAPTQFGCPYSRQNTRTSPTILSCSNYVFPQPDDWPEHVYNTGYWFIDEEAGWEPPADLLDFIHKGAPPVYVGFGSIGDPALATQTTELVMQALKYSEQRGILAIGWNGMTNAGPVPEEVFILESAPHAWLFPQMAAVVHHGGAGTTAAGLRAGVPGVIVPSTNDQFAWGRRVYELGAGPKPVPRRTLSADKLAQAIRSALSEEVKAAARDLGSKIQSEKGTETAARIIIDCLATEVAS